MWICEPEADPQVWPAMSVMTIVIARRGINVSNTYKKTADTFVSGTLQSVSYSAIH